MKETSSQLEMAIIHQPALTTVMLAQTYTYVTGFENIRLACTIISI